jgi:predicted RecB family endonuclease
MDVTKGSGENQEFSHEKFCRSVRSAGAPADVVAKVCSMVEKELVPGIRTEDLYSKTARYLEKENFLVAARYKLKGAIMELGPAGFFFEEYVAAILREYGYTAKVGRTVRGRCVSHEIDIQAERGKERYLLELKYHNRRGLKSDAQVAMYMYARVLDIGKGSRAWLLTNTKFTKRAIAYAECMGIRMTGWQYPKHTGLEQMIVEKALYPITVLPSARRHIREQFAKEHIMFVRDVLAHSAQDLTKQFGIPPKTAKKLMQESYDLV